MSSSSIIALSAALSATVIGRLRGKPFSLFEILLAALFLGSFLVTAALRDGLFQGVPS